MFPISATALSDGKSVPEVYYEEFVYDSDGAQHKIYYDGDGKTYIPEEKEYIGSASANLPSSYDSRTYNRVTSVKSQNPFGTCWAFAFCAAAESSLISQGYATTDINLSEAHLAWFRSANYIADSSVPVQRDRIIIPSGSSTFTYGGHDYDATATVARWSGFTTEEKFPYSTSESAMQFPTSAMFECDYNLVSSVFYPKAESDAIKDAIMRSGAVATSYYDSSSNLVKTSSDGYCYYQNVQTGTNHAVTCVGWNDNYPASNFKSSNGSKPAGNGAWLIKNSWGTLWGSSGYFWLSYYDTSNTEFCEVIAKPAGDYDNNYQYDGVYSAGTLSFSSSTAYSANIFTAEGTEKVKGASFFTADDGNYSCTVSLYTGLTNAQNPKSGVLRESKTVNTSHKGFYSVDFNNSYLISRGEKFSIVVKFTNSSGNSKIRFEHLNSSSYSYNVQDNQSFYSSSGSSWYDNFEKGYGNMPIKAFTVDYSAQTVSSISITSLPKTAYFAGQALDLTGLAVTATYSDGTTKNVGLSDLTVTGFNSSVTGTQTLTVNYGGKTATFNVTVAAVELVSIEITSMPKTEYFVGDTFDTDGLNIMAYYNDGSSVKPSSFSISYPSSLMTRAGTKTITVLYGGKSASYQITVREVEISSVTIRTLPSKTQYFVGDSADYTGLSLTAHYNNGTTQTVSSGFTVAGFSTSSAGQKTLTVTYSGKTAQFSITVIAVELTGIEINTMPSKLEYLAGEDADFTGLTIKASYNNGTSEIISAGFETDGFDSSAAGEKTVTVTYNGKTDTFTVSVIARADYSEVDAQIAAANEYIDSNLYTDASIEAVISAIGSVVRDYPITRQDEVDLMAQAIRNAVNSLVEKPLDTEYYQDVLAFIPSDMSCYTDSSVSALNYALAQAQSFLNENNRLSMQAEFDILVQNIYDAISNLEYLSADFTELDGIIAEINYLNEHNGRDENGTLYSNFSEIYETYLAPASAMLDTVYSYHITDQSLVEQYCLILRGYLDMLVPAEESYEFVQGVRTDSSGNIYGFKEGLTSAKLLSTYFTGEYVTAKITLANSTRIVGTGSVITVTSDITGEVIASYTVIIFGDVDGNGKVEAKDEIAMTLHYYGEGEPLQDAALKAANLSGTRVAVDAADIVAMDAVIAGQKTINQQTGKAV